MEKYFIFYQIFIILLILVVGYLIYKNKSTPSNEPPKIIYIKKKGLYDDSLENRIPSQPIIDTRFINKRNIRNPNLPPLALSNKMGILTSISYPTESPLNLYGVVVDSWREVYAYYAEDKNGFKIPLPDRYNYKFTNADVVEDIPSKPGKWSVLLY